MNIRQLLWLKEYLHTRESHAAGPAPQENSELSQMTLRDLEIATDSILSDLRTLLKASPANISDRSILIDLSKVIKDRRDLFCYYSLSLIHI